jgi:hypothetical protein
MHLSISVQVLCVVVTVGLFVKMNVSDTFLRLTLLWSCSQASIDRTAVMLISGMRRGLEQTTARVEVDAVWG